jgi:hypothetical protein
MFTNEYELKNALYYMLLIWYLVSISPYKGTGLYKQKYPENTVKHAKNSITNLHLVYFKSL